MTEPVANIPAPTLSEIAEFNSIPTSAYKDVRCDKCQRAYVCTPSSDYYNWQGVVADGVCVGGVCERCLIGNLPLRTIEVTP